MSMSRQCSLIHLRRKGTHLWQVHPALSSMQYKFPMQPDSWNGIHYTSFSTGHCFQRIQIDSRLPQSYVYSDKQDCRYIEPPWKSNIYLYSFFQSPWKTFLSRMHSLLNLPPEAEYIIQGSQPATLFTNLNQFPILDQRNHTYTVTRSIADT